MAPRKKEEHAWKVSVSLTPYHRKMIEDILDMNDPDFPSVSRVVQVALREWFDEHVEQESVLRNGEAVVVTKVRRGPGGPREAERASRPSFSEAMDPFAGYKR